MSNEKTNGQKNDGRVSPVNKESLLEILGKTSLKGMDEHTKLIIFCKRTFERHVKFNSLLANNFAI